MTRTSSYYLLLNTRNRYRYHVFLLDPANHTQSAFVGSRDSVNPLYLPLDISRYPARRGKVAETDAEAGITLLIAEADAIQPLLS